LSLAVLSTLLAEETRASSRKHTHLNSWLWKNERTLQQTRESRSGWAEYALQEDLIHILSAILEGLDKQLG